MFNLVVFSLDQQKYALNYNKIHRIIRAVKIFPLPNATRSLLGIINVQGEIIPVINLRHFLKFPDKELKIENYIIICRLDKKNIALVIDDLNELITYNLSDIFTPLQFTPNKFIQEIVKKENDFIYILNINIFLTDQEILSVDSPTDKTPEGV